MTKVTGGEAANSAWHQWRTEHTLREDYPSEMMLELHEAFTAGFGRGAKFAFVQSSKLAPALASLDEFLSWLRAA